MDITIKIPQVREISIELGISPAQVIISWHVQRGARLFPIRADP